MKALITLILVLFSYSAQAEELNWKLTPMIGMGFRFDTDNPDYQTSYNNQRNDAVFLTGKVFVLDYSISKSSILLAGFGYHYQLNECHSLSFSPFAIRGEEGFAFSVDIFPKDIRGGWFGFSVGFAF